MKAYGSDQDAARRPKVPARSGTAPVNHPLLWLQRRAGNTAVSQLMTAAGGVAPATPRDDGIRQTTAGEWPGRIEASGLTTGSSRSSELALQRSTAPPSNTDWLSFLPTLKATSERAVVELVLALGIRDENKITNLLFWAEHPEKFSQKLDPAETELVQHWLSIRDTTVRPVLQGPADKAKSGGKPKKKSGAKPKAEPKVKSELSQRAEDFIEENRLAFGLSVANESHASAFYKGKGKLRAMSADDIAKYVPKYQAATSHFDRSLLLFRQTSLAAWTSGEDVAFIGAIATREGGGGIFRTDDKKVVSGGQDTHVQGVSGMDNLGNAEYRKEFKKAGLYIEAVSKKDVELKDTDRNPAWIEAKDLMFAHMITTANHEKLFRNSYLASAAKKTNVTVDSDALWAGLTDAARRTWLGLFYSGIAYVGRSLRSLFAAQRAAGKAIDLNGILTKNDFPHIDRVVMARATALRAATFEHLKAP